MFIWSEFLSLLWMSKLLHMELLLPRHPRGGEGGPRNGGRGPTGCRSIAAAGSCSFRPDGLQGISLFFSFPSFPSQVSYLQKWIRPIYVLRRVLVGGFNLLIDCGFRPLCYRLFPDNGNYITRHLNCCFRWHIPTVAINFSFFPSSIINPDNCNKNVIFQA